MREHRRLADSPENFISTLEKHGLLFNEPKKAISYVDNIGHFRLLTYMYPFLQEPKEELRFKPGTTFQQVLRVYGFDKKLRLLLFNELEKIEVAFRNLLTERMVVMTGDDFWTTNHEYVNDETMSLIKKEYNRSTDDLIALYKKRNKAYPPSWVIAEILTFGTVTWIYKNLAFRFKKDIARRFYLNAPVMDSWMNVVVLTRNACCHHARIWNKIHSVTTLDMNCISRPWIPSGVDKRRTYYNICTIKYFLDIISPGNDFLGKIIQLLRLYPEIDIHAMGFPSDWQTHDLWQS